MVSCRFSLKSTHWRYCWYRLIPVKCWELSWSGVRPRGATVPTFHKGMSDCQIDSHCFKAFQKDQKRPAMEACEKLHGRWDWWFEHVFLAADSLTSLCVAGALAQSYSAIAIILLKTSASVCRGFTSGFAGWIKTSLSQVHTIFFPLSLRTTCQNTTEHWCYDVSSYPRSPLRNFGILSTSCRWGCAGILRNPTVHISRRLDEVAEVEFRRKWRMRNVSWNHSHNFCTSKRQVPSGYLT